MAHAGRNMMKLAICPCCRVVHQVADPKALDGATDERRYRLTHCRLCKTPSRFFKVVEREVPELRPDEIGYPAAVVPSALGESTAPGGGP